MEANNKKKKTIFILTILVIAAVAICVIGIFAKKAYDRHQEEIRIQAIETKNGEIDQECDRIRKNRRCLRGVFGTLCKDDCSDEIVFCKRL